MEDEDLFSKNILISLIMMAIIVIIGSITISIFIDQEANELTENGKIDGFYEHNETKYNEYCNFTEKMNNEYPFGLTNEAKENKTLYENYYYSNAYIVGYESVTYTTITILDKKYKPSKFLSSEEYNVIYKKANGEIVSEDNISLYYNYEIGDTLNKTFMTFEGLEIKKTKEYKEILGD